MRSLIVASLGGGAGLGSLWLLGCHPASPAAQPTGPVAAAGPATPPPTAAPAAQVFTFVVITSGRHEGDGELRLEPDGARVTHFTFNDRGRGPDLRATMTIDAASLPRTLTVTGHDYLKAPVDEHLDAAGGTLAWKSTGEHGESPAGAGFYIALNEGLDSTAVLVQAMRRTPDHHIKLLPSGEAWIDEETTREVEIGGAKCRIHRVAIAGLAFQPFLIWLDDHDQMFASVSSWTSIIRVGAESVIDTLVADDQAWAAARAAKLARSLAHHPPAAGLAITHARLYDSLRKTVVPDATVIVVGDRITKVGDARTPIPAGAQVLDAHGRTLMPGLWDMHVHLGDNDGILDLASGITSVRDLGNDIKELSARVARFDAGSEVGPHVLRAGLIDGPGPFTAPTGLIVNTPEQATAAVQTIADAGYQQVKIYSSVAPALVPVIVRAAHAHHLRVSGHIPNGMRASDAVEAGYDEIQHVNFLFLQFLARPDDDTRTPARFTRVAEGAAALDLRSPEVVKFFDLLVAHKTVLDPTLAAFHAMFTSEPDDLAPVIAPYARRLPAQVVRGAHGGGLPAPDGVRQIFRASFDKLLQLVKLAWDRKLRIVAGTDDIAGLALSHELELYVRAGIPAPEVLSLATIGAARVMGVDRDTGSITAGKRADLILVDGDPTHDITTLRNTDAVVCRGVVYDPAELFAASGMRARQ